MKLRTAEQIKQVIQQQLSYKTSRFQVSQNADSIIGNKKWNQTMIFIVFKEV